MSANGASQASHRDGCAGEADDLHIITCAALRCEIESLAGAAEVQTVSAELHDHPQRLCAELNRLVSEVPGSKTILLGFGHCACAVGALKAGRHRLVLPAVDNCIALLLGSEGTYLRELKGHPGTLYYTRGWVEEVNEPHKQYRRAAARCPGQAAQLAGLHFGAFGRLVLVETGSRTVDEKCRGYLQEVSRLSGLGIETLPGSKRLLRKLMSGPYDDEFIVADPGEALDGSRIWGRWRSGQRSGGAVLAYAGN